MTVRGAFPDVETPPDPACSAGATNSGLVRGNSCPSLFAAPP